MWKNHGSRFDIYKRTQECTVPPKSDLMIMSSHEKDKLSTKKNLFHIIHNLSWRIVYLIFKFVWNGKKEEILYHNHHHNWVKSNGLVGIGNNMSTKFFKILGLLLISQKLCDSLQHLTIFHVWVMCWLCMSSTLTCDYQISLFI